MYADMHVSSAWTRANPKTMNTTNARLSDDIATSDEWGLTTEEHRGHRVRVRGFEGPRVRARSRGVGLDPRTLEPLAPLLSGRARRPELRAQERIECAVGQDAAQAHQHARAERDHVAGARPARGDGLLDHLCHRVRSNRERRHRPFVGAADLLLQRLAKGRVVGAAAERVDARDGGVAERRIYSR